MGASTEATARAVRDAHASLDVVESVIAEQRATIASLTVKLEAERESLRLFADEGVKPW